MKNFQNWWLKVCCFLTGYDFYILSNCSEISVRKVRKYTAALLIVVTVWAFVGYCFCHTYMKLDVPGSIFGALTAVLMIIQIEKQVLLSDKANKWLKLTRIGLALLMAIIGSLVIDQIIFKDDIEKAKLKSNQKQVEDLLPGKTKQISDQIAQLNTSIAIKESERKEIVDDFNKHPTISSVETSTSNVPITKFTTDTATKTTTSKTAMERSTSKTIKMIANPKINQLPAIDAQLSTLNSLKTQKDMLLLSVKADLEKEVNNKIGFLDELGIMFSILKESTIAAGVYFIWLAFLLLLELLILIGKANDSESDYDKTVQKQMAIHFRKIELL
ncbi:DUF4407 domain-containing protein [Pedobacter hartonius]|uniref:DUF4407 domain-containing protein n=1 Tax=Pedobacter hartonius TaxID=425514 RepID=A0A1H4HG55_9SPHI|nr:DUF4407 domain-containing protein [Pedobacter hartonius]SEB20635.1 protein of unknown function [Pedobacter hartonius]